MFSHLRNLTVVFSVCFVTTLSNMLAGDAAKPDEFPPMPPVPALSAAEQLKLFELPEGYSMELVLDESAVKEPVQIVFDGNGRMYVAEMRTYMQDIDATNEQSPLGVVSLHESTKKDGVFDKHSTYIDKLLLPRMILALDDRVLVGVTNTNDLHIYKDTNGDGVADGKVPFFEGGNRGGNMEHQPSGLLWSMDNWIYTTYNSYRLRWKDGKAIQESIAGNGGQWGMSQDDHGKVWFSNAGGEKGFINFQTHLQYMGINHPEQLASGFMEVFPLVPIPDVQGGPNRFRPVEKTLNHFTASCGHEIFRGDRLPAELRGNALLAEPVGRLIRRATVEVKDGITYLSNPHKQSEFIRSRDPNFRPVNMITGPDGCLYIVDMYRGIIQQGNWVKEGSYLRKVVKQYGLDKNFGRGRIWRLVHKDFKPGPQPKMLDETPAEWVAHLSHPNGWWRDTAQKLLVLKGDKSVVPALKTMAQTHENSITREHALWTLEGLGAVDNDFLAEMLKDKDPYVRAASIRVTEQFIKAGNADLTETIVKMMRKDPEPVVVVQSLLSQRYLKHPKMQENLLFALQTHTSNSVKFFSREMLNLGKSENRKEFSAADAASLKRGGDIYANVCFSCHGVDGKGMPMQGAAAGTTLAPPLSGSKTIIGHRDAIVKVLLNGLKGPINGKTYEGEMAAMPTSPDEWIADVSSFVRNSFGNSGAMVTKADVKRLRESLKSRTTPWTIEELHAQFPVRLSNSKEWKISSSHNEKTAALAADGKLDTRFDSNKEQDAKMWLQVELPQPTSIAGLILNTGSKNRNDFPREYKVEASTDGKDWGSPLLKNSRGYGSVTEIDLPEVTAKYLRVSLTKGDKAKWSVAEIEIIAGAGKNAK